MRHQKTPMVLLSALLACSVLLPRVADAIPAFARKYQFSCTTCHAPFPRLKAFGEEFAGRGFRMEEAAKEPTRATYDVGDPLLKLPREAYLAFRLEGHASFKEEATAEADIEWPWAFKILSGGPIHDRIAYYFYFIIERGEVAGLEDAYVQYNSIFDLPVDLMAGQFQVSDPLFKRELRLERLDYEIYRTTIGASGLNLTYDRGLIANWHAPEEFEVVAQIVNGNGIGEADHERNFDSDKHKNGALRVARVFGPARVGLFGYYGKQESETGRKNRTLYFGPDLAIDGGERFGLSLQYLERRDDDPDFAGQEGDDWETRGGFVEATYLPHGLDGRWSATLLYNNVDSDDEEARRESASLTGGYLLARNARIFLEEAYDMEEETNRLTLGIVTAF